MVKTVVVRWKIMQEYLGLDGGQVTGSWHLPRRVALALQGCPFHFCAYQLPDEEEKVEI